MEPTVRKKDVSEALQNNDQASDAVRGRNVSYNETTRKNALRMQRYVWSETQRQDQQRTHSRDNESVRGFQKDHGEKIELVRAHRLGSNRLYEGGKRGQERGQERGLVTLQCAGRRGGPCERKFTRKRARFLEIGTSKLRHRHVRCSVGNWVD